MGIKSNNSEESYYNYFSASGYDAAEFPYPLGGGWHGNRGVWAGGAYNDDGSRQNVIDYRAIDSAGNCSDFGDLTSARESISGCSDTVRGVFNGGWDGSNRSTTIEYILFATTGNGTSFGELSLAKSGTCSLSVTDSPRAIFAGGYGGGSWQDVIEFVTFGTGGTATDFGNLTVARTVAGTVASTSRGVFAGGSDGGYGSNVIGLSLIHI